MTTHKKEEEGITLNKWFAQLALALCVLFIGFLAGTLLRSYKLDEIDGRLNKQDILNATIATSLTDIKDALNEIKQTCKPK